MPPCASRLDSAPSSPREPSHQAICRAQAASDELDAAVSSDARPERDATEPCAVCGGPTVLCCSGCEAAQRFTAWISPEAVFYCSVSCQQKDRWLSLGSFAALGLGGSSLGVPQSLHPGCRKGSAPKGDAWLPRRPQRSCWRIQRLGAPAMRPTPADNKHSWHSSRKS